MASDKDYDFGDDRTQQAGQERNEAQRSETESGVCSRRNSVEVKKKIFF